MKQRNYMLYLKDILISLEKISRYINGRSYEDFAKDEVIVDAVVRNLEIIGEASRAIPDEIKDKFPDIPWKSMISLRNLSIHEYFRLDLKITWDIVTKNLPETQPQIEAMLKRLDESQK